MSEHGAATVMMTIPKPTQTDGVAFGGYRTLPWASISGESTRNPFD